MEGDELDLSSFFKNIVPLSNFRLFLRGFSIAEFICSRSGASGFPSACWAVNNDVLRRGGRAQRGTPVVAFG